LFTKTSEAKNESSQETIELYNIFADPHERDNVASANPKKVAELKKELAAVKAADRDDVVSPSQNSPSQNIGHRKPPAI